MRTAFSSLKRVLRMDSACCSVGDALSQSLVFSLFRRTCDQDRECECEDESEGLGGLEGRG